MKNFLIKLIINLRLIITIFLLCFVIACGSKNVVSTTGDRSKDANALYTEANNAFEKKEYKKAAELFSKITYEFPYYSLANKAHLMEIYSNYLLKDYDAVIFSVENYIKIHPVSPDVAYAYYMKALAYYAQIAIPQRDQSMTLKAKDACLEVIARFPTSSYAKDAKAKLVLVDDHLAAHEMVIGRYYLGKEEMSAAIERFKNVIYKYATTSQVEEALFRLVEAYLFLGMKDEAQKHVTVLGHNYPNSTWYKEGYQLLQNSIEKQQANSSR